MRDGKSGCSVLCTEKGVEEQGAKVRALKEGEGLTNSDPPVKEAVAELIRRKEKLQQMNDRMAMAGEKPVE